MEEKDPQNHTQTIKKMAIGAYISIITLNINGLKAPTKRHRLAEWIQKQNPYICCLQETHFRPKDTYRLKVRGWKNIFHANGKQKQAGVSILISDKIDLKIKKITRDRKGHYIMIKGSIQEEDITIVNIYAPNIEAPQYIRQTAFAASHRFSVVVFSLLFVSRNFLISLLLSSVTCWIFRNILFILHVFLFFKVFACNWYLVS